MTKAPYVFQSRNELINNLQSKTTKAHAEEYFSQRLPDISSVVHESIAGNTFRAFQKLPKRPSVVFRDWALDHLRHTFEAVKNITDHENYAAYVHEAALDLCAVWSSTMNAEIGYGRSTKLLNLVLKRLACLDGMDGATRHRLIGFQHVPLDIAVVATEAGVPAIYYDILAWNMAH
jgi:hypothetical protein